jgi:hypothetical protein
MRTFALHRHTDPTGISGTGVVAEGVQWSDGTVAVRWLPAGTARPDRVKPTLAVHDDIDSVEALHGHNGNTTVVWTNDVRAVDVELEDS